MKELTVPTNKKDLKELDDFLNTFTNNKKGILWAEGFLCAVQSCPYFIKMDYWQPVLFDGEPEFESMEQAQKIFSLLFSFMNTITDTLNKGTFKPMYETYSDKKLDQKNAIRIWCEGYSNGSRFLDSEQVNEEVSLLLFPMIFFSETVKDDQMMIDITQNATEKQLDIGKKRIKENVKKLYKIFYAEKMNYLKDVVKNKATNITNLESKPNRKERRKNNKKKRKK